MAQLALLNCEQVATVSKSDVAYLRRWDWSLNGRYVSRGERNGGKYRRVLLHRVIAHRMGLSIAGKEVDHRDRNRLNNTRRNLRAVSKSINQHNAGPRCDSTTRRRGISRRKDRGTYTVRIQVNGKRRFVGDYVTLDAAVKARNRAERSLLNGKT